MRGLDFPNKVTRPSDVGISGDSTRISFVGAPCLLRSNALFRIACFKFFSDSILNSTSLAGQSGSSLPVRWICFSRRARREWREARVVRMCWFILGGGWDDFNNSLDRLEMPGA